MWARIRPPLPVQSHRTYTFRITPSRTPFGQWAALAASFRIGTSGADASGTASRIWVLVNRVRCNAAIGIQAKGITMSMKSSSNAENNISRRTVLRRAGTITAGVAATGGMWRTAGASSRDQALALQTETGTPAAQEDGRYHPVVQQLVDLIEKHEWHDEFAEAIQHAQSYDVASIRDI